MSGRVNTEYLNVVMNFTEEQLTEILTPRQLKVISKRFGLFGNEGFLTLKAIGEIYGVNRERIRQIESKAMRKLRHRYEKEYLDAMKEIMNSEIIVQRME